MHTYVKVTSSQNFTTTGYVDSGLTIPVLANSEYDVEFTLHYTSSIGTEALGLAVTFPAGTTNIMGITNIITSTALAGFQNTWTASGTGVKGTTGTTSNGYATIKAKFTTGANAGAVTVQGSTETAGGNTNTINRGWGVLRKF